MSIVGGSAGIVRDGTSQPEVVRPLTPPPPPITKESITEMRRIVSQLALFREPTYGKTKAIADAIAFRHNVPSRFYLAFVLARS